MANFIQIKQFFEIFNCNVEPKTNVLLKNLPVESLYFSDEKSITVEKW